jgi:hypothetical protein
MLSPSAIFLTRAWTSAKYSRTDRAISRTVSGSNRLGNQLVVPQDPGRHDRRRKGPPLDDFSAFQDLSHLLSIAVSKQLQHRWADPYEIIILLSVQKNLGAVLKDARSKCMFRMSMRLSPRPSFKAARRSNGKDVSMLIEFGCG